jgi:hypothetical protein
MSDKLTTRWPDPKSSAASASPQRSTRSGEKSFS